ncbi:MAG: DUF418 domain-containing protein [Bacteroidetes bacterium]|nr:MAG: DUF418 domain-containing protein [Bacteroidota bacterium]
MSTALQPLSQSGRDTSLDMLRGFALAGVLLTFCAGDVGSPAAHANTFLDEAVKWTKWILIENRMYTMLIAIFGIGFYVQLEKAKQKGASLVPVFSRRLVGLLLIGFVHAILLSTRDILMFYGLAGIVLLFVRNATNRQLVLLIAIIFIIVPIVARFGDGFTAFSLVQPNNYADHLQHNWQFFKLYHQIYPIYCEMTIYFILGFIIGRVGLLRKIKAKKKLRTRLLIISLVGSALLIPLFYFGLADSLGGFVSALHHSWQKFLAVVFFRTLWMLWMLVSVTLWVTTLITIWSTAKGRTWLSPLAPFGQMALSNYLIQSLILVPYLLAFDKYNNVPPFNGFVLFLIVLAMQLLFSSWWMKRYLMGPFEWVLRSFTYWQWQPLKKSPAIIKEYQPIFLIKKSK